MNKAAAILYCIALFCLASCAGYDIQPAKIKPDWSSNDEGYVIYEPKPYLRVSVTQTKDGPVYASDIAYLPNLARPYRVTTWCFLAKADITFGLTNGWMLTNVASKVDTTDMAKTAVDIAKGMGVMNIEAQAQVHPFVVHFYEIRVNAKGEFEVATTPSITLDPAAAGWAATQKKETSPTK